MSVSFDKDAVAPNCVNYARHVVVAFKDVRNVFDVIQQCANGGRALDIAVLIFLHNI